MATLRRSITLTVVLALFATPLALIVTDIPHWAALLRFCHNLWAGIFGSNGMVPSHLILFALAAWVVLRIAHFAAFEVVQRLRWQRLTRVHTSVSVDSTLDYCDVASEQVFAVTVGWFRPQTYCSAGLRSRLSRREFLAVLRHEASHRRLRDPLRVAFWTFVDHLFPMLPYLGRSARAAISEYEYRADRAAEDAGATRRDLLSALRTAVSSGGTMPRFSAAPFAAPIDLLNRVRLLRGEPLQHASTVRAFLISVAVLGILFVPSITMRANLAQAYHAAQCDASLQSGAPAVPMSAQAPRSQP